MCPKGYEGDGRTCYGNAADVSAGVTSSGHSTCCTGPTLHLNQREQQNLFKQSEKRDAMMPTSDLFKGWSGGNTRLIHKLCLKTGLGKGPKGAEHISGFKQTEKHQSQSPELGTRLPAGSTKQSTVPKFYPAVCLSGNDQFITLKQTVLTHRQIKPKQVNW